ncbi:Crp/Fnr family transcriptional regulator [Pseudoalteromonas sp. T1lg21]|uniref:Crp/Fnr family transcriptional regulator n=1 Tax=Pseudoalteromonas sp. T1lg21 TaxID=2077095 RepID=UPI000CF69968|nr:Crp/Fnr family transcriptional regulator [Pseudoalteromonas sp. T1lg21]
MIAPIVLKFPELIHVGHVCNYKKKQTLLNEGDICDSVFIIEKGCVRAWFNGDGHDVTFQFFFEGDIATSFESLKRGLPALYNIETITDTRLRVISKKALLHLLNSNNNIQQAVDDFISERLYHYQALFISRIKNNPKQRYEELLNLQPNIFDKVPHHYIATYLGMTPVSLSRIRAKNR